MAADQIVPVPSMSLPAGTDVVLTAPDGDTVSPDPPLTSVEQAFERIRSGALRADPIGTVGLELEHHLVDLADPARPVSWERLTAVVAGLDPMPGGSLLTLEPGGQVELSTLPAKDISAAVAALAADQQALQAAFAAEWLGLVSDGTDPAREPVRQNPTSRYAAMAAHFSATGAGRAGSVMMCSTAALQLNVNAGPHDDWPTRVSRLHRLAPVLVAISACSPWLAGAATGWRSTRQQIWEELDHARCGPLLDGAHPDAEWASYALLATTMLVRDPAGIAHRPVTVRAPFADWISGAVDLGRRPTFADLDYHLSTLFPPIRPKGFLEIRCIDAVPGPWWRGLAGIAVTLIDDPVASDAVADRCASLRDAWTRAARHGLADAEIAAVANDCVTVALNRAPLDLHAAMASYADLVRAGRTPGDELAARCERDGPVAALAAMAELDA